MDNKYEDNNVENTEDMGIKDRNSDYDIQEDNRYVSIDEEYINQDGVYSMKKKDIQYNHWQENISGTQSSYEPEAPHETQYQYWNQHQQQSTHEEPVYESQPIKSRRKIVKKAAFFMIIAILFGVISGAAFQGTSYLTRRYFFQDTKIVTNKNQELMIGNMQIEKENEIGTTTITAGVTGYNDISEVVENVMPSIVSITSTVSQSYSDFFGNQYNEDAHGSGSGIIVGKSEEELLIVTNHHVITDSKAIKVTFINNDILDAKVKGTDQTADLAVVAVSLKDIKEETLDKIQIASLGDSTKVKVGELSIAIGNALGYGQSVTVGYISAKDREVNIEGRKMVLLQTDAAINPGNSGGALLNINGEVIGINSVKYASNQVEGMGYAIPISKATPIINELMNKVEIKEGEEGYLGIMGRSLTSDFSSMYNIPVGAYVIEVLEGGASDKAGILPGDIITAINGLEATSMESVKEKVSSYPAGTKIQVTIYRRDGAEYKEQIIDVVLEKMDTTQSNEEISEPQDNLVIPPFGYEINP